MVRGSEYNIRGWGWEWGVRVGEAKGPGSLWHFRFNIVEKVWKQILMLCCYCSLCLLLSPHPHLIFDSMQDPQEESFQLLAVRVTNFQGPSSSLWLNAGPLSRILLVAGLQVSLTFQLLIQLTELLICPLWSSIICLEKECSVQAYHHLTFLYLIWNWEKDITFNLSYTVCFLLKMSTSSFLLHGSITCTSLQLCY